MCSSDLALEKAIDTTHSITVQAAEKVRDRLQKVSPEAAKPAARFVDILWEVAIVKYLSKAGRLTGPPTREELDRLRKTLSARELHAISTYQITNNQDWWNEKLGHRQQVTEILQALGYTLETIQWFLHNMDVHESQPDEELAMKAQVEEFISYLTIERILKGQTIGAVKEMFAALPENELSSFLAEISNRLKEEFIRNRQIEPCINQFYRQVIEKALEIKDAEIAQAMQVISAKALSIIFWIKEGIREAEKFRITTEEAKMLHAHDKERGPSYLDVSESGIAFAHAECRPGIYWRGWEGIKKLVNNIMRRVIHDKAKFDSAQTKIVFYLMLHGFIWSLRHY